uniref:exodeoxyribonuclease III n=1 Tax=Oryzias latipes TaxID=8090 RepID=A0A3P9K1B0_ORYLA
MIDAWSHFFLQSDVEEVFASPKGWSLNQKPLTLSTLSIASLNVNGLTTPKKRGIILQKLRKENIQLALLQETHLNDQEHEKLKKLGFRNTYYSSYKQGRKRGVAILFSNKTNFETDKVIKGKDGQYIIVKGRMGDAVLTIVNVYAPPESDKQFFKSLFNVIAVEAEGILICGGDFNVSLNFEKTTTFEIISLEVD